MSNMNHINFAKVDGGGGGCNPYLPKVDYLPFFITLPLYILFIEHIYTLSKLAWYIRAGLLYVIVPLLETVLKVYIHLKCRA